MEFGLFEYKTEQERKKQEQIPQSIVYEPRGAQIEALYALQKSRAEGARRALVQESERPISLLLMPKITRTFCSSHIERKF